MKTQMTTLIATLALSLPLMAAGKPAPKAVTAVQIVNLLTSPQTASCMRQLQSDKLPYQLIADQDIARTESKNGAVTTIVYDAVEGGDMVVGNVILTITEKWGSQFGFPESHVLYVDSCSVKFDIQD